MSIGITVLAVLFAGFAVSYGWGIRGFVIGGEKGALLPGALMGLSVAFFAAGEGGQEYFLFFAATGALTMFYGGTETYAQTMSFILHRDIEGPYYNKVRKGVIGIFLKGALWFAIPGFALAMLPGALSGKYTMWDVIIMFALFPIVSFIGTKIFNVPYDKEKKRFPKLYYSHDRREEWGSNVMIIAVLAVFAIIRGDFLALGAGLVGFVAGGFGFLIGLILYDVERRKGDKIFGSLHKKHYIDGWKIMEHAFGAFAGGGLMLYFMIFSDEISERCNNIDISALPLGQDKYLFAVICLALLAVTAIQYPVSRIIEKKTGKEPDIHIFEIIERPLWSCIPLIFIFLGATTAASFCAFGTLSFALCEKCSIEWYERSRYKKIMRTAFAILWPLLMVCYFLIMNNISLMALMILYTVGYTGACVLYSFMPDNIIAYRKKEKTFSAAFGSGITVTGHLVVQSIVLVAVAIIIG